jgi:eukaryotic-like serine/threonine-protein kinase
MPANVKSLLIDQLRASGLLEKTQLEQLARLPEAKDPDPRALARQVLQRGWLSRFQLNLAAQGKAADLVVGPYVLLDRLGEGGMGQVYKARHRHMGRVVALKVIRKEKLKSAEAVQRFYQEVQAAAQLSHPNIVLAYDAGEAGSTHFLSMELVDGHDLARLVKDRGPLPVSQACD